MRVETIGNATLYLGDCREILPTLPKVDAVITDPPYGIGASSAAFQNAKKRGNAAAKSKDYGESSWDNKPPTQEELSAIASHGKYSIFWGGNYFQFGPQSCWLVWDKDNGNNGYADCELAWTNLPRAVRKFKWRWMGMLQENMAAKEKREHPTQKPVALLEWCINLCPSADTVLDAYMGSGTTGVAAMNLGKNFIGIEREEKYFDIACRRISEAQSQQRLFAA